MKDSLPWASTSTRSYPPRLESWNGPGWWWLIAVIMAVLYGSLMPFQIDLAAFGSMNLSDLFRSGQRGTTAEDIAVNILIYIPIGLGCVLCGRHRHRVPYARLPLTLAVGALLSAALETLQQGIAERVSSWTDVRFNTLGTLAGSVAVISYLAVRSRTRLPSGSAPRPFAAMARAIAVGLLLYHLIPFDFITTTDRLHEAFARARWTGSSLPSTHVGPYWTVHATQLLAAAWFALLGYVRALSALECNRRPALALALAVKHVFILAAVIECVQVFTVSHAFDLGSIFLRTEGAAIGAWMAIYIVDASCRSQWRARFSLAAPTPLLVVALSLQIVALFAKAVVIDPTASRVTNEVSVLRLPFEHYWRIPAPDAFFGIVVMLVTYGALALLVGVLVRRQRTAGAWAVTGLTVTLLAGSLSAWASMTANTPFDGTEVVLALLATVTISRIYLPLRSRLLPTRTPPPRRRPPTPYPGRSRD